jgi:hypothetical protein
MNSDDMFQPFPKIPRLKRTICITEKIDGTNAQVHITGDGKLIPGSRNRVLVPGTPDNFGFRSWCEENHDELMKLGPGIHYGEWWGAGIGRRYGLTEKRFSLFNADRWSDGHGNRPACCSVVPKLYHREWSIEAIEGTLAKLREGGSVAAPGFMNPEGVVVYHSASGMMFKVLLENDELPKGKVTYGESLVTDPR